MQILNQSDEKIFLQLICAYPDSECKQKNYSAFLENLNNDSNREADHVYAMWSDGNPLLSGAGNYKVESWNKYATLWKL